VVIGQKKVVIGLEGSVVIGLRRRMIVALGNKESEIFDGLVVMHFRKQIIEYLLLCNYY